VTTAAITFTVQYGQQQTVQYTQRIFFQTIRVPTVGVGPYSTGRVADDLEGQGNLFQDTGLSRALLIARIRG
jgi:predicted RNA-binding protein (virulence factor B family)